MPIFHFWYFPNFYGSNDSLLLTVFQLISKAFQKKMLILFQIYLMSKVNFLYGKHSEIDIAVGITCFFQWIQLINSIPLEWKEKIFNVTVLRSFNESDVIFHGQYKSPGLGILLMLSSSRTLKLLLLIPTVMFLKEERSGLQDRSSFCRVDW